MADEDQDLYAILGVEKCATPSDITKAFRRLALVSHPDRGGDPEQFSRIGRAYECLSDPKARARYDGSGRTAPLTVEEEFRESFFGRAGREDAPGGAAAAKPPAAATALAAARVQEHAEARRRLDEAARRDAARRAAAAPTAPPAPPPPPAQDDPAFAPPRRAAGGPAAAKAAGSSGGSDDDVWDPARDMAAGGAWRRGGQRTLPTQEYRVVPEFAYVRQEPSLSAPIRGKRARGERVVGVAETFDGWVHLSEDGWIIKDMLGRHGVAEVLSPVGLAPVLAVPRPLAEPGPVRFEVVFRPHVAVRSSPSKEALIMGVRRFGEEVVSEVQTYGGWVRLQDGHFVLGTDVSLGRLLRCKASAGQQPAAAPPDAAAHAASPSTAPPHGGPGRPRGAAGAAAGAGAGASGPQAPRADGGAPDARRASLRARAQRAEGCEQELRDCIEEGVSMGFREESALAQRLLDRLLEQRTRALAEGHAGLLERLAAAAASGDRLEIRSARDAAVRGGVDKKEIARVFSLSVVSTESAATDPRVPTGAPPADPAPPRLATGAAAARLEAAPEAGALALGARVRLTGLRRDSALDGLTGVLVAARDAGRWQVLLDGGGMKLARCAHLEPWDGEVKKRGGDSAPPETPEPARDPVDEARDPVDEASATEPARDPVDEEAPREAGGGAAALLSGVWVAEESGEWMGTVCGARLQWADGPEVDLQPLGDLSFSCEMTAEGVTESFSASLHEDGRLVWSDGDVWVRERP